MCFKPFAEIVSMQVVSSSGPHDPDQAIEAHRAADAADISRLRSLGAQERAQMLEAVCAAAAEIEQSRLAAGMGPTKPAPWPSSTWEFLRKHAINARG
jgi:hypothetical protein